MSEEEDMQVVDAFFLLVLGVGGYIEGLGGHLVRQHGVIGECERDTFIRVMEVRLQRPLKGAGLKSCQQEKYRCYTVIYAVSHIVYSFLFKYDIIVVFIAEPPFAVVVHREEKDELVSHEVELGGVSGAGLGGEGSRAGEGGNSGIFPSVIEGV